MTELPSDVLMRLGPSPQDLTRLGSTRVLRGNGLVAKVGSPEGMAREAFLFGEAAALLPVSVPTLVDAGPGWILMEDVGGEPAAPDDVAPLEHLAPMHELFIGATGIEHERFRDVFGREREGLLALARGSANAAALPEPLASLLDDPSPLDAFLAAEPRTLVHGDAWSGNVLTRAKDFVWLDWTEAGAAPAAYDLSMWLYGSAWVPGSTSPEGALGAYLAVRTTKVEPFAFKRAVDACAILGFLLTQLARLTDREPDLIERVIERRNLIAIGLLD
jgi:aminoglycoside phosphotransferase (APT) family kinase protein